MSEERLVFPPSMQGLFLGVQDRLTPEVKRVLLSRGLDVDHLPPAMPIEAWRPHLRSLATLCFPELPEDEGLRMLGVSFLRGWSRTAVGQAASMVLRVVGTARALTRLNRAFRTADNFTEAKVELLGGNEALITINEVNGFPTYWMGVLQGGIEVMKWEGTVAVHSNLPPGVIYRVTWR